MLLMPLEFPAQRGACTQDMAVRLRRSKRGSTRRTSPSTLSTPTSTRPANTTSCHRSRRRGRWLGNELHIGRRRRTHRENSISNRKGQVLARPKRFELLIPRFVVCTKRLILLMSVPNRRNCARELRRINPVPRIYFPSARLRWAPTYWSRG
jgi:hypothetical protein